MLFVVNFRIPVIRRFRRHVRFIFNHCKKNLGVSKTKLMDEKEILNEENLVEGKNYFTISKENILLDKWCIALRKNLSAKLREVDCEAVSKVPHRNEIIPALVYDVYDGDTCKVIILHGYAIPMKLAIRINGIDTPEVRCSSKQSLHPELQKKAGLLVRNYVKELLENQIISLKIEDWDKFGGRVLGTIYLPDTTETLTTHLIKKKYGKEYHGEKKEKFTKEELEYIIEH